MVSLTELTQVDTPRWKTGMKNLLAIFFWYMNNYNIFDTTATSVKETKDNDAYIFNGTATSVLHLLKSKRKKWAMTVVYNKMSIYNLWIAPRTWETIGWASWYILKPWEWVLVWSDGNNRQIISSTTLRDRDPTDQFVFPKITQDWIWVEWNSWFKTIFYAPWTLTQNLYHLFPDRNAPDAVKHYCRKEDQNGIITLDEYITPAMVDYQLWATDLNVKNYMSWSIYTVPAWKRAIIKSIEVICIQWEKPHITGYPNFRVWSYATWWVFLHDYIPLKEERLGPSSAWPWAWKNITAWATIIDWWVRYVCLFTHTSLSTRSADHAYSGYRSATTKWDYVLWDIVYFTDRWTVGWYFYKFNSNTPALSTTKPNVNTDFTQIDGLWLNDLFVVSASNDMFNPDNLMTWYYLYVETTQPWAVDSTYDTFITTWTWRFDLGKYVDYSLIHYNCISPCHYNMFFTNATSAPQWHQIWYWGSPYLCILWYTVNARTSWWTYNVWEIRKDWWIWYICKNNVS